MCMKSGLEKQWDPGGGPYSTEPIDIYIRGDLLIAIYIVNMAQKSRAGHLQEGCQV